MQPIVHGLEDDYGEEIEFVYIDIDDPDSYEAKIKYGFRVQPHFLLVAADGEVLEQWYGYNEPMVFEDAFANVLSN
jgi:hypothetical protein